MPPPVRRQTRVARRSSLSGTEETTAIYWWLQWSTRGVAVKYVIKLHRDGSLSCDCPGWVYHKHKCKHTDGTATAAQRVYALFTAGETLPTVAHQHTGEPIAGPMTMWANNGPGFTETTVDNTTRTESAPRPAPARSRVRVPPLPSSRVPSAVDVSFNRKIEL